MINARILPQRFYGALYKFGYFCYNLIRTYSAYNYSDFRFITINGENYEHYSQTA